MSDFFRPYSKAEQLKGHQQDRRQPKLINKRPKKAKRKKQVDQPKMNVTPPMKNRKKFSKDVIRQAAEKFNGLCANCGQARAADPHHIRFRSDGGKGVLSNCLPVCRPCHVEIHREPELAMKWKDWAKAEYGFDYWMDEHDKELHKMEMQRQFEGEG